MVALRSRLLPALLTTATAAALFGCSSSAGTNDFGDPTGTSSGGNNSSKDGSTGTSGDDATSPGAGDDTTDDGGGTTGLDATMPADAGKRRPDASTPAEDGGASHDSGSVVTSSDASPDESAWLDPMNAARAAVGEAPLTWNPIAAQVALAYANMCNYEHNPNRNSDYKTAGGGNGGLGENIAAGAPTLTIAGANMGWIDDEKPAYDYATNSCNTSVAPECGHYTQIVWKTTTSVGCALVTCNTNTPFGTKYGTKWGFAVCDYAPPGNIILNGTLEKPY